MVKLFTTSHYNSRTITFRNKSSMYCENPMWASNWCVYDIADLDTWHEERYVSLNCYIEGSHFLNELGVGSDIDTTENLEIHEGLALKRMIFITQNCFFCRICRIFPRKVCWAQYLIRDWPKGQGSVLDRYFTRYHTAICLFKYVWLLQLSDISLSWLLNSFYSLTLHCDLHIWW